MLKKTVKIATQLFSLALFIFLFIKTSYLDSDILQYPANLFFRFDPLVFLSASIAGRRIAEICLPSLVLVILALFFGRFYCWWLCPLGTIFEFVSWKKKNISKIISPKFRYYFLIFILFSSILTLQFLWVADPNALLLRTISLLPFYGIMLNPWAAGITLGFFVLLLLINLLSKRFWCNHICPLGALYSLLARFKIKQKKLSYEKVSLSRRGLLLGMAGVIAAYPLLRLIKPAHAKYLPPILRPPGADRKKFLDTCIHCGECWKICPNKALHPAFMETGIEGMFTPVFRMRQAYCEYECNLCGQVCPTGAIKNLPIEAKRKYRIGTAVIDRKVCYPWATGTTCFVCEEHCPVSPKAIGLEDAGDGVRKPYVNAETCIGCGICENKCPVPGESAIVVGNAARPNS